MVFLFVKEKTYIRKLIISFSGHIENNSIFRNSPIIYIGGNFAFIFFHHRIVFKNIFLLPITILIFIKCLYLDHSSTFSAYIEPVNTPGSDRSQLSITLQDNIISAKIGDYKEVTIYLCIRSHVA